MQINFFCKKWECIFETILSMLMVWIVLDIESEHLKNQFAVQPKKSRVALE